MNKLLALQNKEVRITSVELVEIINEFRKIESEVVNKEYKELLHKDFMKKVRKEVELLEMLGLGGERNVSPSSYINSQNKKQPCFSLNRDGMLQMLNSESTLVRYRTIEYINQMESKLKKLSSVDEKKMLLVSMIEDGVDPSEIARYTALVKDSFDGENMIITCSQVVDALNIEGLTTTIFNKWLEHMGLGEYTKFPGEKKKVFQPNDEYIKMFVEDGMAVTGTTFKRDKVKCVYTTKLVNTIKENYIDNLSQYVKIATIY